MVRLSLAQKDLQGPIIDADVIKLVSLLNNHLQHIYFYLDHYIPYGPKW